MQRSSLLMRLRAPSYLMWRLCACGAAGAPSLIPLTSMQDPLEMRRDWSCTPTAATTAEICTQQGDTLGVGMRYANSMVGQD